MGKSSGKNGTANGNINTGSTQATKPKRTRKSVPRDSPPRRSSIYRGVTRCRWTGHYEAHLWDTNCWNASQNKKGRQVYLGAYDDEAAAHAYDLAALKYWGHETILNFPLACILRRVVQSGCWSSIFLLVGCRRIQIPPSPTLPKTKAATTKHQVF